MKKVFSIVLMACALLFHAAIANARSVQVELAVGDDGRPTSEWLRAIKPRISPEAHATVAANIKPLNPAEAEWLDLIQKAVPHWLNSEVERLDRSFQSVTPPENIRILVSNQGGNDGFTLDLDTVCTDLSALVRNYGEASAPGSWERVHRVLSHEYTHVLTKAWLNQHPWSRETPLRSATHELFYEGIGVLRSLEKSVKWVTSDYELTDRAKHTLEELEPELVRRLEGLMTTTVKDESIQLLSGLSNGPFAKKWGALPVALWLALETRNEPANIAIWVEKGPLGVLDLIASHVKPENRDTILAVRAELAEPKRER